MECGFKHSYTNYMDGGEQVAIIHNQDVYIELFPRKYAETEDDPFIFIFS